jgi:GNAT superfamily N-acetyltransferase
MSPLSAPVTIRRAKPGDANRLAALSSQLGYPTTPKQVSARLQRVLRFKTGACFVAESKPHGVIGWIHVSVTPLLEVELRAEINGLVVDENVRSAGVGAQLLNAGEEWARRMGCKSMSVRSNVIRDRAHVFYLRQAYEHYKTQKAFRKSLSPGTPA